MDVYCLRAELSKQESSKKRQSWLSQSIIMPRIPYVFPQPGESLAADKIRERRKDGKLVALDGVLLNAPAIASGYSSLLGAIRQENSLDDGLRELLVSRCYGGQTAKKPY